MNHDDDKATDVAAAIDELLRGRDTPLADKKTLADEDPALIAARRIRASLHPPALEASRREALASTVAEQWRWRRRRRTFGIALAIAATIVLVAVVSLLLRSSSGRRIPAQQLSRETAELIPGPFPPDQTASDRIDLIYADRLEGLRASRLAGLRGGGHARASLAGVMP